LDVRACDSIHPLHYTSFIEEIHEGVECGRTRVREVVTSDKVTSD
jgi:hypothetical protein